MRKFKGFTLSELLIALGIMAVLVTLTISVNRGNSDINVNLSLKKASQTINEIVQNLLNDADYYDENSSFADLNEVRLISDNRPVSDESKFRELFVSMLKQSGVLPANGVLTCPVLLSEYNINENGLCFMSEDEIVWGIPDTDFRSINVVKILRKGFETPYVPVTVYPKCKLVNVGNNNFSCKYNNAKEFFNSEAVVFAIRQDGDIRPYSHFNCEDESHKGRLQCRLSEIISSVSF